jgi:hypothetical protein
MVLHLAEHLDLPLRDRTTLLLSAGFATVHPESSLHSPQMLAIRQALRQLLDGHSPFPAVVVDRWWNIVGANDSLRLLISGVAEHLLRPPVNVLRAACCVLRAACCVLRVSLHHDGVAPG